MLQAGLVHNFFRQQIFTNQYRITRSSLYDSESEYDSNNDDSGNPIGYMPNIEFEFVEVENSNEPEPSKINESKDNIDETQEEQDDEFEFPLFAAPYSTTSSHQNIEAEKDGR